MLKSTHQSRPAPPALPPLQPGWTEHVAPTGHPYYYNAQTKQSTYTRPSLVANTPPPAELFPQPSVNGFIPPQQGSHQGFVSNGSTPFFSAVAGTLGFPNNPTSAGYGQFWPIDQSQRGRGGFRGSRAGGRGPQGRWQSKKVEDRPKSKHILPGYEPWLLVRTKFGRQFVYNAEKGESFWKVPEDLKSAVKDLEEREREQELLGTVDGTVSQGDEGEIEGRIGANGGIESAILEEPANNDEREDEGASSSEYEEAEVTEDEPDENPPKRQRTEEANSNEPREFNEDDITFQLAAMGQDYGLDPGEYGDGTGDGWEEGAEGLPLTEEESTGLFKDMLDDHGLNPYTTWDKVVEEGKIIEDERYTILPNMKSRKEVWAEWSRDRIQVLKEQREKAEKTNPLIPYLTFLQKYASPKLYWPEFKRKYRSAPELRDTKLSDKQREKWYRDYIARVKLPEASLKSDLSSLLKSQPLSTLNRSTNISALPASILTDIRYVSLDPQKRDPLVEAYISTLAPAPEASDDLSPEQQRETDRKGQERERRERAFAERERRVAAEKQRQRRAMEVGRERLREEELEVDRAMRVGKEGLRAQLGAGFAVEDESKGAERVKDGSENSDGSN